MTAVSVSELTENRMVELSITVAPVIDPSEEYEKFSIRELESFGSEKDLSSLTWFWRMRSIDAHQSHKVLSLRSWKSARFQLKV